MRFRGPPVLAAALVLALSACDDGPRARVDPDSALSLPTKDDVALVDGKPLTLGAFAAIRSTVAGADRETVLWLGIAALALQNDSRARGHEVSPKTALNLAKFAAGLLPRDVVADEAREYQGSSRAITPDPATFKSELDALIRRAVVHRNEQAISALSQAP